MLSKSELGYTPAALQVVCCVSNINTARVDISSIQDQYEENKDNANFGKKTPTNKNYLGLSRDRANQCIQVVGSQSTIPGPGCIKEIESRTAMPKKTYTTKR